MSEKPLHVQVAEALGWQWWRSSVSGRRCLYAPGEQPLWMAKPADGTEALVSDWDEWELFHIPRYDTDWSAAGPLIERWVLSLHRTDYAFRAVGFSGEVGDGDSPLIAVCHLLLALKAAGKLAA